MRIKTPKEFRDLLINNGWTLENNNTIYRLKSPYNKQVVCITWNREFHLNGGKVGTIINMRDVVWEYDANTGLLQNGVFAVRIK